MRVTNQMIAGELMALNARNLERLADLQSQAAAGKRVRQPHDDPPAAGRALNLKATLAANQTYLQNIASAKEWLGAAEASLAGIVAVLERALNDARQGASDTLGSAERTALGAHVNGLIADALALLNARHREAYLFAGFKTTTQPFVASGSPITGVTYAGDAGQRLIETEPGQTVAINAAGGATTAAVFSALLALRDDLNANNGANIRSDIATVQSALEGVLNVLADLGTRQQRLSLSRARLEKVQIGLREFLSRTEDADLAEVIVRLKEQEVVYQASLQTSARLTRANLFDFWR